MSEAKKLFVGTILRGVMWAAAGLAGLVGTESISEETGKGVASFIAVVVLAGAAMGWSYVKDRWLKKSDPNE